MAGSDPRDDKDGKKNDKKGGSFNIGSMLVDLLLGIGIVRGLFGKERPRAKHLKAVSTASVEELFSAEPLPDLPAPHEPRMRRTAFHVRSGWSEPKPESLPAPTYAPAGMAFGVVFIAFGLVSKWYLVVIGLLIAAFAIWNWVGEMVND